MSKTIKNIISGSSSVINISPARSKTVQRIVGKDSFARDGKSISHDWGVVGGAIRGSMDKVTHQDVKRKTNK